MSYLITRAERAVLGALLADQPPPPALAHLTAEDFGHRLHQRIFTLATELRAAGLGGDQLLRSVAAQLGTPGADATWLHQLRAHRPEPAHLAAYARMIHTASFRREIATHAERIATTAATASTADRAEHLTRLAGALTRQAAVFATLTEPDPTADPTPAPAAAMTTSTNQNTRQRAAVEDQLLADLLRNPEQAADLARFLPAETFTSGQRREVYQTILGLAVVGEPVDEVIVGWEIERQRALARVFRDRLPQPPHPTTGPEPDEAYLTRLATTPTTTPAVDIGRALLTQDLHAVVDRGLTPTPPTPQHRPAPRPAPYDPGLLRPPTAQPGNGLAPRIDR